MFPNKPSTTPHPKFCGGLGTAGWSAASPSAAHPLGRVEPADKGLFFSWTHTSPSLTLQPPYVSGNLANQGHVVSESPFLGRYLHFYRHLGEKNVLKQRKGFNQGHFRLWEQLKQVMSRVAIASSAITSHRVWSPERWTWTLETVTVWGTAVCGHFYHTERTGR